MQHVSSDKSNDILILEEDPALLQHTTAFISTIFPHAVLTSATNLTECAEIINKRDFDIVILDYNLENLSEIGLIQHLKVKDNEPAVLVISESINPSIVNEINSLSCQRYLHKRDDWIDQLGPTLRQLVRIRKLEDENRRLVAQLTEAKMFLEEKNKRLDEFSATVAHDIRGPLGGVSMKLEFILDKYKDNLDDKLQKLLCGAFDSTRRVIDLVQAMYNYARLGSKAAVTQAVDLKQLVVEVIKDLSFDDKLDIQIGLAELPQVWGNPELLRRVFLNLISNAVKYNDQQTIIINIGFEKVVSKTIGEFAEIFVSDNGPGISQEDQRDIFSMFKRGSNSINDEKGLGIGLSVVRRIIELHYGDLKLESQPGCGAKFILTLPLEKLDFLE